MQQISQDLHKSTYTETTIIPSCCYEVFIDFLLEHTQGAVEETILHESGESLAQFKYYPREHLALVSPAQAIIIRSMHDPLETPLYAYALESKLDSGEAKSTASIESTKLALDSGVQDSCSISSQNLIQALESLAHTLSQRLDTPVGFAYRIETKRNKDWIALYQQSISPLECANYYIRASWHPPLETLRCALESSTLDSPALASYRDFHPKHEIIINPALAFGSGHHASTFICIEMLSHMDLRGKHCLDVGCGSGILGIIISKQGGIVEACDVDDLAVIETRKNFAQNATPLYKIWHGSIDSRPKSQESASLDSTSMSQSPLDSNIIKPHTPESPIAYDLVCANIVADVLACMHHDLLHVLKPNGILLLSGILESKLAWILQIFGDMRMLEQHHKDEWVSLKLARIP